MGSLFFEITVIICLASFLTIIFRLAKQPPMLSYIVTGIIVGAFNLFKIGDQEILRNMGELGICLLLFLLGLELRLSEFKSIGKTVVISGIFHMLITGCLSFLLALALGFSSFAAFYISIALSFSSTVIVVKLLSDKKDLRSLYGKISIGFSLVQDFFAILFLILISGFKDGGNWLLISQAIILILVKIGILLGLVIYLSKNLLPKLIHIIARSEESLFLFSLAFVFGFSALVSSPLIGFSIEIGGFLAGLSLANTSENFQIVGKLRPVRDFFVIIFFVFIGLEMGIGNIGQIIFPAIILSSFVLLIKPGVMLLIMKILGYRKRTALLTGINVAQISEFSLIIIFLGNKIGHLPNEIVSLITLVDLITFAISTFMIAQNNSIYSLLHKVLELLQWKNSRREHLGNTGELSGHILLIGANHLGRSIIQAILEAKDKVIVVDFDPDIVIQLKTKGIDTIFGDIADLDIQEKAYLAQAKLIISTISDLEDNLFLLRAIRHANNRAKVILMALEIKEAKVLYAAGADYVILPYLAGSKQITKILRKEALVESLAELKQKDLEYLG